MGGRGALNVVLEYKGLSKLKRDHSTTTIHQHLLTHALTQLLHKPMEIISKEKLILSSADLIMWKHMSGISDKKPALNQRNIQTAEVSVLVSALWKLLLWLSDKSKHTTEHLPLKRHSLILSKTRLYTQHHLTADIYEQPVIFQHWWPQSSRWAQSDGNGERGMLPNSLLNHILARHYGFIVI